MDSVFPWILLAIVLVCPVSMWLMMRGHGKRGNDGR